MNPDSCKLPLKLGHLWHRNELPDIFCDYFQFASDVHSYGPKYMPLERTNIGKQSVSSIAVDFWQQLPFHPKELKFFSFSKKVKQFLPEKNLKKLQSNIDHLIACMSAIVRVRIVFVLLQ